MSLVETGSKQPNPCFGQTPTPWMRDSTPVVEPLLKEKTARFWPEEHVHTSQCLGSALGEGHSGETHRAVCRVLPCLPASLGLNFCRMGRKREVTEEESGKQTGCPRPHMHVLQLTLTTYLDVAH